MQNVERVRPLSREWAVTRDIGLLGFTQRNDPFSRLQQPEEGRGGGLRTYFYPDPDGTNHSGYELLM